MSNLFVDAQQAKNNKSFRYNSLNGLNNKGIGESKIQIIGELDHFTKKTLFENYNVIAKNLKVYPTIKIYPRGYELNGGFGGFYYSDRNHIDLIDHFYLISILSHEMRHAFQYIYFPDLFFSDTYNSTRGYLDCGTERDARQYSIDYCFVMEYWEEVEYLKRDEEKIQLVIQNKLSPGVVRLNDDYFRRNPSKASTVPRTYHYDQNKNKVVSISSGSKREANETALDCIGLLVIAIIVIYIIKHFLF